MFLTKAHKERERFYLLPGQGGAAYRRKQRRILFWSTVVALVISGILATAFYFFNSSF